MTREEKIALLVDELEDIRCDNFDADTDEDKTLKEAIRAIKALEQESCYDCISRQAVLEQINCWIGSGEYKYTNATDYLTRRMQELPSVTPQPKMGRWIRTTDKAEHLVWECDKCSWQQRFNTNYCPNCGCAMKGELE